MARRFKSLDDCRRYLANLINRVEAGKINAETASKLAYITNSLARILEADELEKRIERIEEQLNQSNSFLRRVK